MFDKEKIAKQFQEIDEPSDRLSKTINKFKGLLSEYDNEIQWTCVEIPYRKIMDNPNLLSIINNDALEEAEANNARSTVSIDDSFEEVLYTKIRIEFYSDDDDSSPEIATDKLKSFLKKINSDYLIKNIVKKDETEDDFSYSYIDIDMLDDNELIEKLLDTDENTQEEKSELFEHFLDTKIDDDDYDDNSSNSFVNSHEFPQNQTDATPDKIERDKIEELKNEIRKRFNRINGSYLEREARDPQRDIFLGGVNILINNNNLGFRDMLNELKKIGKSAQDDHEDNSGSRFLGCGFLFNPICGFQRAVNEIVAICDKPQPNENDALLQDRKSFNKNTH